MIIILSITKFSGRWGHRPLPERRDRGVYLSRTGKFAISTLVQESDIAGEDGRSKGGEGQDDRKRAIKQEVCLARYPLNRTTSRYYIVTTEQVHMVNLPGILYTVVPTSP